MRAPLLYIGFLFCTGFVFSLIGSNKESFAITIQPDVDDRAQYTAQLREVLPHAILVQSISFDADVHMEQSEFFYLVDIRAGQLVSYEHISQAVCYLIKKQKFESIVITGEVDGSGVRLHVQLTAFWTFRKLKFRGIFVGKEFYRQYYIMEYGDRFDIKKHNDSVEKIAESFKKDGYCNVKIDADFIYDDKTKAVTVCLDLYKGSRFALGSVTTQIESTLDEKETQTLRQDCYRLFMQPMLRNWYNRDTINAQTTALKNYLIKKGYVHLEIELTEHIDYKTRHVDLHFIICIQYKKKFCFTGNHFFSSTQLLDCIVAFGRSLSLLPASIISEELMKAYHAKGFWHVSIEAEEVSDAYHFAIAEGDRVHVDRIELRNIHYFNKHQLVKKFFTPVLKKKYYDAELIDQAIERTLAYFVTDGFWQSAVLKKDVEPIKGADAYAVVITFDEGIQSFLINVSIAGFPELEGSGPFKQFDRQAKKVPFNPALIDEQRQWLLQHFQKAGYYQPKIKPSFDKHEGDISVTWHIELHNTQMIFGKTVLLGANTFPFSYVQRELDYKIGDPWHTDALRHSISRLQKLEVFESVQLFPDRDVDHAQHAMLLKLQKDDPYEMKVRTGFGVQHVTKSLTTGGLTYRIGGSFLWKNPINRGDQFRIDADFTKAIRLVNMQYRLPWICNLPINTMLQGYTNRFEYPGFIGSQKNLYTVIQQGFLVNFASVYNVVDAALSTGFELIDTFINESKDNACFARAVAHAINFKPELLDKNIPFFLIQPTCILFYLDSTINPTKGSFSVLSAKCMFPMAKLASHNFFIRLLAEQSFFIPVLPLVFALRVRIGHIFHPQFSTIIPIERFYLGGANSIRSYETDQCPPLGAVCDNGKELFVPQGGRSLVNLNLEMRFPLYEQFGGVLFSDIGALSTNRLADIKAEDLLSGIGFGLRYNTPIGPLRFDVAWRLHKHDGVGRPYAWFLSFGNAFI